MKNVFKTFVIGLYCLSVFVCCAPVTSSYNTNDGIASWKCVDPEVEFFYGLTLTFKRYRDDNQTLVHTMAQILPNVADTEYTIVGSGEGRQLFIHLNAVMGKGKSQFFCGCGEFYENFGFHGEKIVGFGPAGQHQVENSFGIIFDEK